MSGVLRLAVPALMCLAAISLPGQAPTPAPQQTRVLDGKAGSSLADAYKSSCRDGTTLILAADFGDTGPIPAASCDHHVAVLDLRQADSLTGRLNVKRFGAAGDGKTDDTEAVRATIAYALAHLSGRNAALVYFPAGDFVVKGELRINSQISVTGDGPAASTIKEIDPASNLFTVTRGRGCSTETCLGGLSNLGLAGNGHLTHGNLIEIDSTEDYRLEHLVLYNHGGRGLQINGNSERLDSHDLSISLVRWPLIIGTDANESYFYNTKVMFPGVTADGWCYNVNCVNGKYPTQGPIAPDPHAAVTAYMPANVGFYGGSIKSLQMIGGFKTFNSELTTLDHFYLEYGYVNPGVIAGGVPDWTKTTAPLNATDLAVAVENTDWMPQYYTSASDVRAGPSSVNYVLIPPDFSVGSKEASSLGNGITRGSFEFVGVAGFAGDGALHIGKNSRGTRGSTARAWPAGTVLEAVPTGIVGLRISSSHINEQMSFKAMGTAGANLTPDCDQTGVKTCAEIIAGYIPDGRWVQQWGGKTEGTSGPVGLRLDNIKLSTGAPTQGLIAVHSNVSIAFSGALDGTSNGETADVPYSTSIAKNTGGSVISTPTYSNGHRPQLFVYDADHGRMMNDVTGLFTQIATIPDGRGQWTNGRQYANSFSLFDIPPTGTHPLNSVTFSGGPSQGGEQGLRYDHWTGASWASLFYVRAAADGASADLMVNGITHTIALQVGNGPVLTSLSGKGGEAAAASPSAALGGTTAGIGGRLLQAGQCITGAAAVNGAAEGMVAAVSPLSYPGDGFVWQAYVSRANTVTVKVCALAGGTPALSAYAARVFP